MFIQINISDNNGWPILTCGKPVVNNGDTVRLQNYGLTIYNAFKQFCDRQREATKIMRAGGKPKCPTAFNALLVEAVLGEPLSDRIEREVKFRVRDMVNKKLREAGIDPDTINQKKEEKQ